MASAKFNDLVSEIMQQLLVDLGIGSLPSADDDWPIYSEHLMDQPDDAMSVVERDARGHGRTQTDGLTQEHFGIQVLVRSNDITAGYKKAASILSTWDQDVQNTEVTIGSNSYTVQTVNRTGAVVRAGIEGGRYLYSVNAYTSIVSTTVGTGS